jgi:tRNA(Ile)-lysidine synthase
LPGDLIARFRADLDGILSADGETRFGLAVSGGPDSMAMLLLANAALPGRVAAATVDHGLRAEAADEAAMVARLCGEIGVPHAMLPVVVSAQGSMQAAARDARYAALASWAKDQGLAAVLTAHHADDQAETLVMRLARGAGLSGLRGISRSRDIGGALVVRPLLGWRRVELAGIVAGIATAHDPSNDDPHYDRTHARALIREAPWIDPLRLAASASHLADAEEAIEWVVTEAMRSRGDHRSDGTIRVDLSGLPYEIRRRMIVFLVAEAESPADGPTIERALALLDSGRPASIGRLKLSPGRYITIVRAPDRR